MLHGGVAVLLRGELGILQFHVRSHLVLAVARGQLEHRVVERVEAGQRDELEGVTHLAKALLEHGDGFLVEVLLPVEARRAVIGQLLARILGVDRLGEAARFLQVGRGGLAPDEVGVRRIGEAAADRLVQALAAFMEAFHGALAGQEGLVVVVDVRGDQARALGIGARDDDRRHASDVGRQPRGDELLHGFLRGYQHLAAHVAALLRAGELILEVHARHAGFDHLAHQFIGVEHATETRLGVGDDRREPVAAVLALGVMDLVGAKQRLVDAARDVGHRVHRIQRLVRIHRAGGIGIGGHLPAGEIDRFQAGFHLLHGLVAGQCAQRVDEGAFVQRAPQALGPATGQRVLDLHGAAQAHDVLGRVGALDAVPAIVVLPVQGDLFGGMRLHGVCSLEVSAQDRRS